MKLAVIGKHAECEYSTSDILAAKSEVIKQNKFQNMYKKRKLLIDQL